MNIVLVVIFAALGGLMITAAINEYQTGDMQAMSQAIALAIACVAYAIFRICDINAFIAITFSFIGVAWSIDAIDSFNKGETGLGILSTIFVAIELLNVFVVICG